MRWGLRSDGMSLERELAGSWRSNWQSRSEGMAGYKCQAAGIPAVAHIPAVDNPAVGGIPAAAADIHAAAVDSPGAASAGSPDSDRYTPFDLEKMLRFGLETPSGNTSMTFQ